MFNLRPYQIKLIEQTREQLRSHNSVILQSPTGSGKTALSAAMLGAASQKGKRSFFICHRIELIEQTARTFDLVGIPYGFIASGFNPNPFAPVQICSIDTLKVRVDKVIPPDFCIWDECHHLAANGWAKVHGKYPNAKHVGLTATPERLDGKGLGKWFQAMVKGPSVEWLIKEKYLSDYKLYAPSTPDLSGVHKRMGDFIQEELDQVMDNNVITGDAISHYLKYARGKRFLVFCGSVKHSLHVAEQFRQAGIMAVHVDGKTNRDDRRKAFDGLRSNDIMGICNVEIAGEGVDIPHIEVVISLRPTQSFGLCRQQWGRALRPALGKQYAIILDHAGNTKRHGLPDDHYDWSLEGNANKKGKKKDEEKEVNIRQCPKCFFVHRPSPVCPSCGHVYEIKSRLPEEVEGELIEVDKESLRRVRFKEQSKAQTIDALVALAKKRGYKNPHAWAGYVFTSRQAKRNLK